jgi:GNAT superfamily N-acetyltransferase
MTQSVIARREFGGFIFEIDTAKDRLDIALIHDFLSRCSHWARGIPRHVLDRAIANSLCFGLYRDGEQIGFARVVSDEATFAYLADVFVAAEYRNAGLGQFLVEAILAHEPLQGLRRWHLVTRDAAPLYRRCGFADLRQQCLTYLDRFDPEVYQRAAAEKAAAD